MNERVVGFALVATISCALAVGGFVVSGSVESFAPCRLLYRTRQPVQDSLACQAYAAITLLSLLLFVGAIVLAIAAGVLAFVRRRAASSEAQ
jgi:hypothetical protein